MIRKLNILTIGLLLFLMSCNNNSLQKEQLAKTDSLLIETEELLKMIEDVELDTIHKFYALIQEHNNIFKKKLNGLPKNDSIKQNIFRYGTIEKSFKKIPRKLNEFNDAIELSVIQLNNLKFDVENNLLEDTLFEKYYNDEKLVFENSKNKITDIINILNKQINDFNELFPLLDQFADSLKQTEDIPSRD